MIGPEPLRGLATLVPGGALLAGVTARDDATGPEGAGTQVSLSVAVPDGGSASSALGPSLAVIQTDGEGDELTIDRVALVLAAVELETENEESPEASGDDSDDCEELDRGPLLVDFEPDSGSIEKNVTVQDIPPRFTGPSRSVLPYGLGDRDRGKRIVRICEAHEPPVAFHAPDDRQVAPRNPTLLRCRPGAHVN